MYVGQRNEALEPDAVSAAGDFAHFLSLTVEELRATLRRLLGVDEQTAQAFGRLPAPVNARDHLLAEIASFRVTHRFVQLGLEDDVILSRVDPIARDARFDAGD